MAITRLSGATGGTTSVKLTQRTLNWSSGALQSVVENYSDGSVNTRTYAYDNSQIPPRLVTVTDTSPARTETISYNADGTVQKVVVS